MNELSTLNARVTVLDAFRRRRTEIVDALLDLDRVQGQIEADRARLLADAAQLAADEAAVYVFDGVSDHPGRCRSEVATEIAVATRRSERTVLRMMDTAQSLVLDLPDTLTALREGRVLYGHAQQMVAHSSLLPPAARVAFEQTLLPEAQRLPAYRFGEKARRARELTHPETMITRARRARDDRGVFLFHDRDGMSTLSCHLPAGDAMAIDDLIDRAARAEQDRTHPDDDALDRRTHTQRRADTFVQMLLRPDEATNRFSATVILTAPAATIAGVSDEPGDLHGYGAIDPATTRLIAAAAPSFFRVLTDPVSTAPVHVTRRRGRPVADYPILTDEHSVPTGRERYSAPPDLRFVLAVDDETCRFPHCGRRANRCELDHTLDWALGGTTTPGNLAYLCRKHHHLKHESDWSVSSTPNKPRHLTWVSPIGREYTTAPARSPGGALDPP